MAILPGSGKSEIALAAQKKADVLITGDIDHHSGIDAVAQGLSIIPIFPNPFSSSVTSNTSSCSSLIPNRCIAKSAISERL